MLQLLIQLMTVNSDRAVRGMWPVFFNFETSVAVHSIWLHDLDLDLRSEVSACQASWSYCHQCHALVRVDKFWCWLLTAQLLKPFFFQSADAQTHRQIPPHTVRHHHWSSTYHACIGYCRRGLQGEGRNDSLSVGICSHNSREFSTG